MIVLGIVGLLALLSSSLWVDKKQRLRVEMKQQMKFITTRIQFALNNPNILQASTGSLALSTGMGNNALLKCILASRIEACPVTDSTKQETFNLILPFLKGEDSQNIDVIDQHIISGDNSKPVRYRLGDGTICSRRSSDPSCNLEARTYFWLSCQPKARKRPAFYSLQKPGQVSGPASKCSGELQVNFRFQLVYKPLNNEFGRSSTIVNYPKDEIFWKNQAKTETTSAMSIAAPTATLQVFFKQDCSKVPRILDSVNGNTSFGHSVFFKVLGLPAEWRCAQS